MSSQILLDSSVLIAFFAKDDSQHMAAVDIFKNLQKSQIKIFLIDHVFAELEKVLMRKVKIEQTIICLQSILTNDNFTILPLRTTTIEESFEFYKQHHIAASKKQYLCLVDIYQIIIARELDIPLLTFDQALTKTTSKQGIENMNFLN